MRRFFQLPTMMLLAASLFLVNACTTDDNPPIVISPTAQLIDEAGFLTFDSEVAVGDSIRVKLSAAQGDNPMNAVTFLQDGVQITDFGRISINGTQASSSAPLLFDDEKVSFTWEVAIAAHADGVATYTFEVSDETGSTDQVQLDITIASAPPSISFTGMGTTQTLPAGTLNEIKVTAVSNGTDLSTIAVYQDGELITAMNRIFFGDASTEFASNPLPLEGDDINGLVDKSIFIRTQSDVGSAEYTIEITNAAGQTASGAYTATVAPTGTPLDGTFTAVLLSNADGGTNILGGLDLYAGENVSVNSTNATIIDLGINGNAAATNWIQKIQGANGGTIKEPSTAQSDDPYFFDDINFKEQVLSAWDGGTGVTNNQSTNQVQVGDMFFVNADNDYFIIKCVEVSVTTTNNEDFYRFDVKQAIY